MVRYTVPRVKDNNRRPFLRISKSRLLKTTKNTTCTPFVLIFALLEQIFATYSIVCIIKHS